MTTHVEVPRITIFTRITKNKFYLYITTPLFDTHRITYLQNAVIGKAKDVMRAHLCDPTYYNTALNKLISCFADPTIVMKAFINQLVTSESTKDYNKRNLVAFDSFLKRLVQAFLDLVYTADLHSSALMKKAEEKFRKWTERTVTCETPAAQVKFQKGLELQAHLYDKIHRENIK